MTTERLDSIIDMSWDQPGYPSEKVVNPDLPQLRVSREKIESQARGADHVDHVVYHGGHRVRVEFNITDGQVDGINVVRASVNGQRQTWTKGIVDLE